MENAPLPDIEVKKDDKDSDSKSGKSRKKKAGDIGSLWAKSEKAAPAEAREIAKKTEKPAVAEQPLPETQAVETGPAPETEVRSPELTPDEIQYTAETISLARKKAAAERPPNPEADPAEALGDRGVDNLHTLISEEKQDPDTALANTLAGLGAEADEIAAIVAETKAEALSEAEAELVPGAESAPDADPEEAPEVESETGAAEKEEAVSEESDEEAEPDDAAQAAAAAAGGGSGAPPPNASGGAAGAGSSPPNGPRPPFGPAFGPGNLPPTGPGGFTPNLAPAAANTANTRHVPEYDVGNPAAAALLGGIIGYLIGRRRGRIKTEKKLLPIQKKLEKEVINLDFQLRDKETKIRRVAAEQVRTKGALVAEQRFSRILERQQDRAMEQPRIERRPAPEAHQLHGGQRAPEHIGHMLVNAEAKPVERLVAKPEVPKDARELLARPLTEKRVETLNRAELLGLSEKIIVDGSSLRQIYENHLIGERGLRRLVTEHLRGGDLKQALRREVVEREIDFERDPAMRDLAAQTSVAGGGGQATLDTLLQKASLGVPDGREDIAFIKARARHEAAEQEQQQKQRHLIDISLGTAIVILILAVVLLYLRKG